MMINVTFCFQKVIVVQYPYSSDKYKVLFTFCNGKLIYNNKSENNNEMVIHCHQHILLSCVY
jgi:hypothetical protein